MISVQGGQSIVAATDSKIYPRAAVRFLDLMKAVTMPNPDDLCWFIQVYKDFDSGLHIESSSVSIDAAVEDIERRRSSILWKQDCDLFRSHILVNQKSGLGVMKVLLDRRRDEVRITERALMAAVWNEGYRVEVITLLLDRRGDEVRITERVVAAAAENWMGGGEVMKLLVARRGKDMEISGAAYFPH